MIPGIVDQDFHPAEVRDHGLGARLDRLFRSHIDHERMRNAPIRGDFPCNFSQPGLIPGSQRNMAAVGCELEGDSPAYALGGRR